MNGLLLIQVFSLVVFFKIINAKNKDLPPHVGRMTKSTAPSTGISRTPHPSVNLTKLPHENRGQRESNPPTTEAFTGRDGAYSQPGKARGERSHGRLRLTPPRFFEAGNGEGPRGRVKTGVHPERRAGWPPGDFPDLLISFHQDKSKLNRSPTYHTLLAKSMRPDSSVYPSHSREGSQLSDTRGVTRRGERVPSSGVDPEENRPRKSTRHRARDTINGISSPSEAGRRTLSLFYHFNVLREDYNKQLCSVECRKEKNEREFYCSSDFAINGIVHDIITLDKGLQMVTLLVDSHGFYRMGRLYVTPDGFFFKVHILVVDTFNCRRLCPDLKFGGRYIMMGLIYHRRYPLPMWVQERVSGRLKPGDGLVKSSSYVRRFNKKRDQKVQLLRDGNCGTTF
ncbi:UPF0450 protein C17orf58 homolog [Pristis pectinata]|uniref:UPF0450 protein C17orf58 homolog n=1 Tax=Pristis pectinata TaxID=685728 RepID=UPI00223E7F35|nr:UPF0450 protein C17orf58 homolog [Pristis pectinata]